MTIPNQLTFDGRAVGDAVLQIGQAALKLLPDGLTWEELATTQTGDRFELSMVVVVKGHGGNEKIDADNGEGIGPLTKTYDLAPIRSSVKVTAIQRRSERDEQWRKDHGAA